MNDAREILSKVREETRSAFTEEHAPEATAASFALGAFIVLMPTSGTGLLIFALIAFTFSQVNEVALFSTAVVFNPVVKILFYGISYVAGGLLLGETVVLAEIFSLQQVFSIGSSVILGSFIVATTTAAPQLHDSLPPRNHVRGNRLNTLLKPGEHLLKIIL